MSKEEDTGVRIWRRLMGSHTNQSSTSSTTTSHTSDEEEEDELSHKSPDGELIPSDEEDKEIAVLYERVETLRFQSSSLENYALTSTLSTVSTTSSIVVSSRRQEHTCTKVLRLPLKVVDEISGRTESRRGLVPCDESTKTYIYESHLKDSLFGETAKYRIVSTTTTSSPPSEYRVSRSATPVCVKESSLKWKETEVARRTRDNPELETKMMLTLRNIDAGSHHIVQLIDILQCDEWLYLICECYDLTLLEHIASKGARSEQETFRIFLELLDAVSFLHAHKIAHLDISTENIMLDLDGHVRVIDVGQATHFEDDSELRGLHGKPAYYIPKSLRDDPFCAFEQDVWAAGIVLFVLVVGTIPFEAPYTTEQAYQILCQNVGCVSSKELIKRWRKSCLERVASNSTSSSSHTPISNDLLELMCSLMSHEYVVFEREAREYLFSFNYSLVSLT